MRVGRPARSVSLTGAIALSAALMVGIGVFYPLHAQPTAPSAATLPLHGRNLIEAKCSACHGVDGNSTNTQFPKIAGQNPAYLAAQLHAFKSGARPSPAMSGIASGLTDAQIDELARYFSARSIKPDAVENPQLARLGAQIFSAPSPGGPPCVACHGRGGFGPGGMMGGHMMGGRMGMMRGNLAAVPRLYGQHAAYTVQQLDAFASGARHGTVMGPIAAALSSRDRQAVAEYLSGQR